jgi:hypothetical protein
MVVWERMKSVMGLFYLKVTIKTYNPEQIGGEELK